MAQAKGEIKGLRATFDVTGHETDMKDARLKYAAVNPSTHKEVHFTVPVRFNSNKG